MTGNGGTGKATLMTALYQGALERWASHSFDLGVATPAVWKVSALQLSKQFTAWALRHMDTGRSENDPIRRPIVTKNAVQEAIDAGLQPCLFVEELDKYKMDSNFQNSEFFDVIDLIYGNKGQLVATFNLSEFQLRVAVTDQFPLTRRFVDEPSGCLLDFRDGTITRTKISAPKEVPESQPVGQTLGTQSRKAIPANVTYSPSRNVHKYRRPRPR